MNLKKQCILVHLDLTIIQINVFVYPKYDVVISVLVHLGYYNKNVDRVA